MELAQIQLNPERFSAWVQQGGKMSEAASGAEAILIISKENGKVRLASTCPTDKAYLLVLSFLDEFRRSAQEPASDTLMRVVPPVALRGESKLNVESATKKPAEAPRKVSGVPE